MPCITFHIAVCTCARAHPISVSQKPLDRSRSNVLRIWRPIRCELMTFYGCGVCLHVCTCNCKPDLRISGMAAPIVLKVGLLLVVHILIS